MEIRKVKAVFFSPTGTSEKITKTIAEVVAKELDINAESFDFTLPKNRLEPIIFDSEELVIFGLPVIAGRVPNVLLEFLSKIQGNGAIVIPIVMFGNRSYDDALIELRDILLKGGLIPIAAGAFVGEHSFSKTLGKGRPDKDDLLKAEVFATLVAEKLIGVGNLKKDTAEDIDEKSLNIIKVKGKEYPYGGYYKPLDQDDNHIDIRKVKPKTGDQCIDCKICANACPMGSIDYEEVSRVPGICIKCGACIKKCPVQAKYFDDPGYLYHKKDLEEKFAKRAEAEIFI